LGLAFDPHALGEKEKAFALFEKACAQRKFTPLV
jgi:hypothetical protein